MAYGSGLVMIERRTAGELPTCPCDQLPGDDPIRQVHEAVRLVLSEWKAASSPRESGEQLWLESFFSARHLEKLLPGTRVLRISPRTVMTPLARDALKRQGISIQLGVPAASQLRAIGEWAFSLGVGVQAGMAHAIQRALNDDPLPWQELPGRMGDVTAWLLAATGRGLMLITSEPAVAVWSACQIPGVRAALAHEPADVTQATSSLGVNLLVVDPSGKSLMWIRNLGQSFRRAGAPRVPESMFEESLRCESPR